MLRAAPPNMKTSTLLLAIYLCSSYAALAEDRGRDGVFWRSRPQENKSTYVLGVLDGLIGGDFFVPRASPEALVDYHKKLLEMIGKALAGILKDGLDRFHEDFRNRNIKIYRAITVVAAQVNGASDEKAQRLIEHLRQWEDQ